MTAYYNEIDPFAAQWLRNLIAAGHIASGDVDNRSIEDVTPADLTGYTQCHFFAGVGVWSYALRLAGWPDDRPVWTGSCPCQPFSAAGKGKGFADERHVWPAWFHLIGQCKPGVVLGEQVASKDGLAWFDLVHADMEGAGYTVGAADICAAGVGAPHIRQRLYWVADASESERGWRAAHGSLLADRTEHGRHEVADHAEWNSKLGRLAHNNDKGLEGLGGGHQAESGRHTTLRSVAEGGESGGVANTANAGYERRGSGEAGNGRYAPRIEPKRLYDVGWLADASSPRHNEAREHERGSPQLPARPAEHGRVGRPGPTNGHWRDADWLFCRDGKWRPTQPGTFPLAHGAAARVGRLRAYGNAIVPQVAQAFIESIM